MSGIVKTRWVQTAEIADNESGPIRKHKKQLWVEQRPQRAVLRGVVGLWSHVIKGYDARLEEVYARAAEKDAESCLHYFQYMI